MPDLPEELRRFIAATCGSIEHVEVLLRLRASPDRPCAVAELARELGSNEASIRARLLDLEKSGLAARDGDGFRYAPTGDLAQLADQLAETYRSRRLAVIEVIYPPRRDDLRSFLDAFRLKKKPPEDR